MSLSTTRLARQFAVDSLMTPARDLFRASSPDEASRFFHDFDVVPSPSSGRITSYFERDAPSLREIIPRDLLSASTPVIDLPGLLHDRAFFFVIQANLIVGYLHFSDLNKSPARVPFYMLIEAAETAIARTIDGSVSDSQVQSITKPDRYKMLKRHLDRRRSENLDLGWPAALGLEEMLRLARRYHGLKLHDEELQLIRSFRNRVAHPTASLIERHEDVRKLSAATRVLQRLAGSA